uniref:Peptidase aspartic putative domain-containing protein n=1 Tax=Nothobranchius furzeri TaxID=105023 RepID=A0A1A7ZN51_NOTFU
MDPDKELHPTVRPKRQISRPSRFEGFEVSYAGASPGNRPQWNLLPSLSRRIDPELQHSQSQPASFTPPSIREIPHGTPFLSRPSHLWCNISRDPCLEPITPYFQESPSALSLHAELRATHEERRQLLQAQTELKDGLKELNEARTEIKALIEATNALRMDMNQLAAPQHSSHTPSQDSIDRPRSHFPTIDLKEEEEEWPDPPPWPEPEDQNSGLYDLKPMDQDFQPIQRSSPFKGASPSHYKPAQLTQNTAQFEAPAKESEVMHPTFAPYLASSSHPAPTNLDFFSGKPSATKHSFTATGASHTQQPRCRDDITPTVEVVYRGPKPTIPKFIHSDPCEFARLRIALENLLPSNATELFKYQILVDNLRLDEAKLIADAYLNSPNPYTDTMAALHDKFGQPHQLALKKIASVLDGPEIRRGDLIAFQKFSLQVQSLVGLLQTLGPEGQVELNCGSHVARLLGKLPPEQRADFRRHQFKQPGKSYTLHDLSDWLHYESWCQGFDSQTTGKGGRERNSSKYEGRTGKQTVTVLHNIKGSARTSSLTSKESATNGASKRKAFCAYCDSTEHYFSQCSDVAKLSKEQIKNWIQENKRCWRCAQSHLAAQCTLKKPCSLCQGKHLLALHEVNTRTQKASQDVAVSEESCLTSSATDSFYIDRPSIGNRVMLKVVPVSLSSGTRALNTFAILDDGSERTMLLPGAAKALGLRSTPENLPLRTVRQDIQLLQGHTVSFRLSSATEPSCSFQIDGVFTSN